MKTKAIIIIVLYCVTLLTPVKSQNAKDSIYWVDAKNLTIEGMGWSEGIEDFTRLPDKYKNTVTAKVWELSRHSCGVIVRFNVKGSKAIRAKWVLRGIKGMAHMTDQAVSGLDLYVKQGDGWMPVAVGKPSLKSLNQYFLLKNGLNPQLNYEFMLYLPLYNGVSSVELGFNLGATVSAAEPSTKKPLVFYGTSILQGCSASRTGMNWTAMLGRKFNVPVFNFGFSGNGLTEEYFGDIMGEINASAYIIDCLPNMGNFTVKQTTDRTLALVRKLRKIRPNAAIVLVENRTQWNNIFNNVPEGIVNTKRAALKAAYTILEKEIADLYYVEGDSIFGDNTEAMVDGSHPSDLGMYLYFKRMEPIVLGILNAQK